MLQLAVELKVLEDMLFFLLDFFELFLLLLVDHVGVLQRFWSFQLDEFFEGEFAEFDVRVSCMMIVVMAAVGSMLMVLLVVMSVIVLASWPMFVVRLLDVGLVLCFLLLGLVLVVAVSVLVLVVLLMVVMLIVFVRSAEAKGNLIEARPRDSDLRDKESTLSDFGQETESGFDHQLTIIIN